MRITVTVNDLTDAQWEWLLRNVERDWEFREGETRMCVTFEPGDTSLIKHAHRDIPVRAWIGIIEYLKTITPAELAPPSTPFERIGTNSGHGHAWPRPDGERAQCGGRWICDRCSADYALRDLYLSTGPKL